MSGGYHRMRTMLGDGGYFALAVPCGSSREFLETAKKVACFQLDLLIAQACEESYADAEYKSWISTDSATERKS